MGSPVRQARARCAGHGSHIDFPMFPSCCYYSARLDANRRHPTPSSSSSSSLGARSPTGCRRTLPAASWPSGFTRFLCKHSPIYFFFPKRNNYREYQKIEPARYLALILYSDRIKCNPSLRSKELAFSFQIYDQSPKKFRNSYFIYILFSSIMQFALILVSLDYL